MRVAIFFSVVFIFYGCNDYKIKFTSEEIKDLRECLVKIQNLEKKIDRMTRYQEMSPSFISSDEGISLSYTAIGEEGINFNDRIRHHSNPREVNKLEKISGLSATETLEFKKIVMYIRKRYNINSQSYIIYDPRDFSGIYLYEYIYGDLYLEDPERVGYIAILDEKKVNNKWFSNHFIIEDKKEGGFLVRNTR